LKSENITIAQIDRGVTASISNRRQNLRYISNRIMIDEDRVFTLGKVLNGVTAIALFKFKCIQTSATI